MRIEEAYAVQMKNDLNWANGNQYLEFPACSGSRFANIAQGSNSQMSQLSNPNIVIMTIGGNDADFFAVASNCIYQKEQDHDFGPDYADDPQRMGDCAKAIDQSRAYINGNAESRTFVSDLKATIQLMLDSPQAKANPDLRIYQTGYAHFFNLDNDGWCETESFGVVLWGHKPKLSHQLRADINELTENVNNKIREATSSFSSQHVGYISITEAFNGHRFCEANSNHFNQYYDDDVWFWNLSLPWLVANATNPNPSTSVPLDNGPLFDFSSTGNSSLGYQQRPFHPKEAGHHAIMQSIIAQLKADKVPGVNW